MGGAHLHRHASGGLFFPMPLPQKTMTLQRGTYNPVSISFVLMSGIGMLTLVIVLERTLPMWFQKVSSLSLIRVGVVGRVP